MCGSGKYPHQGWASILHHSLLRRGLLFFRTGRGAWRESKRKRAGDTGKGNGKAPAASPFPSSPAPPCFHFSCFSPFPTEGASAEERDSTIFIFHRTSIAWGGYNGPHNGGNQKNNRSREELGKSFLSYFIMVEAAQL